MSGGLHQLLSGVEPRPDDHERWVAIAKAWSDGERLLAELEASEQASLLPAPMATAPCPLCGLAVTHPSPCSRCGDVGALPLGDYLAAWDGEALRRPEVAPFDALLEHLEDDGAVG